ncbi:DUF3999 domain-containing protein [Arenibacter sp. N53]|uniref:DUF3999 family protein n=1 Tax=Arenibacter TaxID=178469 RepID=UPI000CD419F1|nr:MULTISPECIES: DUF3999 family protein [Arenibacter]MCM4153088.1 DUF3999 domain-containing protein [Arenibacter sp. N53]
MKRRSKFISGIILMVCSLSYGQMDQYEYKRALEGVNDQWHNIPLPDSIFGKVSSNLSDIRIYGVVSNKDTIEVPYLLRLKSEKIKSRPITFSIVNTSHNNNGYYYTFEVPSEMAINHIKLEFKQKNFDWKVALQASQEQLEWFTIVDDYRILSIQNGLTDYQFTTISFPNSKYHYYRLLVKTDKEPNLITAKISNDEIIEGNYKNYPFKTITIDENKTERTSEIIIDLGNPVAVSSISLRTQELYDYYRPITISQITDSIKTEQGWKYNYNTLLSGTLSSLEESDFDFQSTTVQKVKITVYNGDNQPLTYGNIKIKGFLHELVARFTKEATYYLTYGNNRGSFADYDIAKFSENIPETLTPLKIGNEQRLKKTPFSEKELLFKNKLWLWGIITLIIIVLGWFSLNMIKKKV